MAIQSLIIHRIQRFQEDEPSKLQLREASLGGGADYEALFSQFKKLFQFKAGKFFGQFDSDIGSAPFQAWLKDHQEGKLPFERLSQMYAEKLKEVADVTNEGFDYYICMIAEERADGDRVYVFLMESSAGLSIDSSLSLDTIEPLNTSKLDLAIRIDLPEWLSANGDTDAKPYLCMVKARGSGKLGEAFAQSLGFKSSVDSAKETETLMEVLANYTKESEPKEAANLRQKAYDFCVEQQQMGESVPLSELSGYLDENQPTRFAEFATNNTEMSSEKALHPDTRKLKHLVRISGKGNGLSLSFSSDLIQQTILFDEKHDTLTITSIPKTLKKQILEHLKEQQDEP